MEDINAITVRRATAYDIDAIAKVQITAWQTNFCNEKLDTAISNTFSKVLKKRWACQFEQGYQVLVAENDSREIVGFVGFCMHTDATQIAEINAFYLTSNTLYQSVGTLLCNMALEEIKRNGYQEAAIWVLEENNQMKSFYEELGFQPTPLRKTNDLGEGHFSKEVEYRISVN
jgi:ribosomal protein S18 acetylase RimI-like enzyme